MLRDELERALGVAPIPSIAPAHGRGFLLRGGLGHEAVQDAPVPTVAARTTKLVASCSRGALRVEASAGAGRHLVASQRVAAGAVLMQADCYATVVSEAADACSRCMTKLPSGGARCQSCGTRFCAESCLEDAGAEHAAECPALATLKSVHHRLSSDLESVRLALRVLARRAVEAHAPDDGEVHFCDVDALLTHAQDVASVTPALSKATAADGKVLLSLLPPPVSKGLTSNHVTLLLLRIKFNSHPISDSTGSSRVGLGLYPAAALMNHSCAFNAVCTYSPGGGVLNVRAVRDVEKDEAVCYSYIDPYQPRRTRRTQVRRPFLSHSLALSLSLSLSLFLSLSLVLLLY